jgi:small subunit ribosomal protein S4
MARYLAPNCRVCRRLGTKLFLKASRCLSEKCALNRRKAPPGERQRMGKLTPYAIQLKEKQKLKKMYGLLERQFHIFFDRASRKKGVTGDNLLLMLETRLDNVVYRLCFASSRPMARQLVLHGHILVNGRKVDIASYQVKIGDIVSVKEKSRQIKAVNDTLGSAESHNLSPWLLLDVDKYEGKVERFPTRDEIKIPVNEQAVVELYSK